MPNPPSERPAGLALLALLALFLAGLVAVYLVALQLGPGARIDQNALEAQAAWQLGVPEPLSGLLGTISVSSLMLVALGGLGIALWRGRPDMALAILVLLVGANASTQILKELLASSDPLMAGPERANPGAFPSGHSTAAASVALAAVMAVGPRLRKTDGGRRRALRGRRGYRDRCSGMALPQRCPGWLPGGGSVGGSGWGSCRPPIRWTARGECARLLCSRRARARCFCRHRDRRNGRWARMARSPLWMTTPASWSVRP